VQEEDGARRGEYLQTAGENQQPSSPSELDGEGGGGEARERERARARGMGKTGVPPGDETVLPPLEQAVD
jgi:hypothetical protein